jgi:hypothetical protein
MVRLANCWLSLVGEGQCPSQRFCKNRIAAGDQWLFSFGKSENGTFSVGGALPLPYSMKYCKQQFTSPGQKNAGTAICDPGVGMYLIIQLFTAAAAVLGKKSASYRPSAALRTAHMVTTEQNTCHDEASCLVDTGYCSTRKR